MLYGVLQGFKSGMGKKAASFTASLITPHTLSWKKTPRTASENYKIDGISIYEESAKYF